MQLSDATRAELLGILRAAYVIGKDRGKVRLDLCLRAERALLASLEAIMERELKAKCAFPGILPRATNVDKFYLEEQGED